MNIKKFILLGLTIPLFINSHAKNILWDGNPIEVLINVNEERRIDFPENIVDLDVDARTHAQSDVLLTPEGRLFWKPKVTYGASRIKAVSVTGTLYLLDISSMTEGGSTETITIIDPTIGANHNTILGDKNPVLAKGASSKQAPLGLPEFLKRDNSEATKKVGSDYVSMTRFALAHYAGPKRLIPKMAASQVSPGSIPRNWVRMVGNKLQTRVLRGWLIDGHYVTALYVRNQSNLPIEFDPRALRGTFEFAASLNPYLESKGQLGDEGLWVFISKEPFSQAARAK